MAETPPDGRQPSREHEQEFAQDKLWWALMLAKDLETCRSLLRGEQVEEDRLDLAWLARAQAARLVRLDGAAVDRFERSL